MYAFHVTLDLPFDAALERIREALAAERLGIVSEIDVQAIFRAKIEKDIPAYRIFGACNPALADRVIEAEPEAGTLLPCNFVLRDTGDGKTMLSFMDPVAVLGLSESDTVRAVAAEAREKLERVAERLRG